MHASSNWHNKKKEHSPSLVDILDRVKSICKFLMIKPGVFSAIQLSGAGFKYTGDGDRARCENCGLEVANWTSDMDPFNIHSKQKPDCSFVRSTIPLALSNLPSPFFLPSDFVPNAFYIPDPLRQIQRRTFSHWPHRAIPSSAQMIEAGFFYCNVGDRVICLCCNLICQKWTVHTDDPCEVHKTLSPKCPYVIAKLIHPSALSVIIINESLTELTLSNHLSTVNHRDPLRSNDIVFTVVHNSSYAELPKRYTSFATWPNENLPSVDDLVRAGFFYTGRQDIVTCFYCNGSLHNLGPNDNPMIKHARWFPNCAYVKQLCGVENYCKIQEAKRAHQEQARANELRGKAGSGIMSDTYSPTNSEQLSILDESTLDRLAADRLDLPISQRLLDQNFKQSIIKKCWKDQLRLKQNDFVSGCDLYIACLILQRQIKHISGKKENIVIPSIKMKQMREQNRRMREQTTNLARSTSNTTDVEMTTSSQSLTNEVTSKSTITGKQYEKKTIKQLISSTPDQQQLANSALFNPCVVCSTERKTLALLPCGHLTTCVPCGHSLRLCPICRQTIKALIRIST